MRSSSVLAVALLSLLCVEAIATRELLEEAAAASAQSFGGAAPAGAPLASQAPSIAAAAALAPSPEPANSMSATPGAAPASSALPAPVQAPSTAESADAPTQAQAPTAEAVIAALAPAPAPAPLSGLFGGAIVLPNIGSASAPAPAPAFAPQPAPSLAPVSAPAPAPVPAPIVPPVCSSKPTCRLFVENQLCCQSEGLLTSATYASIRVLCNQPITLSPDCISTDGPSNVTILDVLNGNPSYSHQFLVNYEDSDFYGHVNIDLERQRQNASASCGLAFAPCTFDGLLYSAMPITQDLGFNVIDPMDFAEGYIGCPAYGSLELLQSWGYMRINSTQCGEQVIGDLPKDFFTSAWETYDSGFQNECNVTATLLNLEAFNGTASIIELEQYDAMTPGAATAQELTGLYTVVPST